MRSRGLEVSLQTNVPGEIDRLDHRLHGFVGTLPLIVVGYDVHAMDSLSNFFRSLDFCWAESPLNKEDFLSFSLWERDRFFRPFIPPP